jgi:hypothetical protein
MADAPEVSLFPVPLPGDDLARLKALVLDSVTSPHSRRAYGQALNNFLGRYRQAPWGPFRKAVVQEYRAKLAADGLTASTINAAWPRSINWPRRPPTTRCWRRN